MEVGEIIIAIGAYAGSKDVVTKLLGPTADYIGGEMKSWTQRRFENIGKIFENAERKAGKKLEEPGAVPPKVLKEILDNGSFADDALAAEYFGGVLASSRSDVARDDRGAAFAALVGRLTTYQLRSHFFFYHVIKNVFNGDDSTVNLPNGRRNLQVFIPFHSYINAMKFSEKENQQVLLSHSILGLVKEELIEETYHYGELDYIKGHFKEATESGILFQPSALGVELFHWAHGMNNTPVHQFLDPDITFHSDVKITTTPGFRATRAPKKALDSPAE